MELSAPAWLAQLEPHRIEDALRGNAYEEATAKQRQCLKTAIAYHALQGEGAQEQRCFSNFAARGFWQEVHTKPADFALVLCAENFCAPARMIAAIMPALLNHVPVYFISIGQPHASLLLTLELLGLEEAFAVPTKAADSIFESLFQSLFEVGETQNPRLILLENSPDDTLKLVFVQAKALGWPTFEDAQKYQLSLDPSLDQEARESITFAHGPARYVDQYTHEAHAFFIKNSQGSTQNCPQIWGQGLEGCWQYPNHGKDFFLQKTLTVGFSTPSSSD